MRINKEDCCGCYNEPYHYGLGGAKKCWSFDKAILILRKKISIHIENPNNCKTPYKEYPNCYNQQGYAFLNKTKESE